MKWNAELYDEKHAFVGAYGRALLQMADRSPGQKILDLGCGTGALTGALAEQGALVSGADQSAEMLAVARTRWPNMKFYEGDAAALPIREEFDTVFSNAVFHWIPDQTALLSSVIRMLNPGGSLVFEMGAKDCGKKIENAFRHQCAKAGSHFQPTFFFPDQGTYEKLLSGAGFEEIELTEFDRPTPLEGGISGLRNWVVQFYANHLATLSPDTAGAVLSGVEEELYPILWDGTQWVADYRRLRGKAQRPQAKQHH